MAGKLDNITHILICKWSQKEAHIILILVFCKFMLKKLRKSSLYLYENILNSKISMPVPKFDLSNGIIICHHYNSNSSVEHFLSKIHICLVEFWMLLKIDSDKKKYILYMSYFFSKTYLKNSFLIVLYSL